MSETQTAETQIRIHPTGSRPRTSPWGTVQQAEHVIPGVWDVSTAGHGGVLVCPGLNALIPAALRSPDGSYEEDEEWCLPWVYLNLPPKPHWKPGADHHLTAFRNAYPDAYEAHFGVRLAPGDSSARDRADFEARNAHAMQVTTAWGDWHPLVPEGKVGVSACPGGTQHDQARSYLVDLGVYHADRKSGRFGVLITDTYLPVDLKF